MCSHICEVDDIYSEKVKQTFGQIALKLWPPLAPDTASVYIHIISIFMLDKH